jgi:hypothetical protein
MKKFIVNANVLSEKKDAILWAMSIPGRLINAGERDVKFKTCYCDSSGSGKECDLICEFDSQSEEKLSEALEKIQFPAGTIKEVVKVEPK